MNKSRILSVALAGALVASVAAVSTISASAFSSADVKSHTVGITGDFAECETWTKDIPMTDDDGDGVYTAEITGQAAGTYAFKVRLDGAWSIEGGVKANWGAYEWEDPNGEPGDRTADSQTNCQVTVNAETDVIKVTFDTTKLSDDALAQADSVAHEITADDDFAYNFWPVTYTVEAGSADAPAEESKTEAPAEESKTDAPATETSDTKPVATGDTTSAIALVGVVLASLGTAVVMTKKASSKD